jgi:hypothetical protein
MVPGPFSMNNRMSQYQYLGPSQGYSQRPGLLQGPYQLRARQVPAHDRRMAYPRQTPPYRRASMPSRTIGSRSSNRDSFLGNMHPAGSILSRGYDPSISSRYSRNSRYSGWSSRPLNRSNLSHPHSPRVSHRSELVPRSYVDRSGRKISIHPQHPSTRSWISSSHAETMREHELNDRLRRQLSLHPSGVGASILSTSGRGNSWGRRSHGSGTGSMIDPSVYRTYSGYSSASDC